MSTYRATRDQRIANDFLSEHSPCRFCQSSTPVCDLATYGARCRACYDAYCVGSNPRRRIGAMTLSEKKALIASLANVGKATQNPRRWAQLLRRREQGGEYMTRVQRTAWREALRPELENEARTVEMA